MIQVKDISPIHSSTIEIPILNFGISAGFPSPALDFCHESIDIGKHLIKNQSSTFFGRASGESMKGAGISDGDLLIIDKSITPKNGSIAVCYLDGEFTLKRIVINENGLFLVPENEQYPTIKITEENQLTIWGIVSYVVKEM